ncbi:amidohydrolase family protein [Flagellimonas flava]|uniref:Imidazolonepropionase n=1 Tax=Flagellimonas flava TaxID=570519 RepID=A0A1M5IIY8_9FLAO|nr:amidohydrolase family protein [Allomuricauda flava]SHG28308.1 Imidazolonepropionase [Allomuricauda flava]
MKQLLLGLFSFTLLASCKTNVVNHAQIEFTRGQWFNGTSFEDRTVWVKDGVLRFFEGEVQSDTIIDLGGKFVTPPFAEAHNHNLESDYKLEERIKSYLDNGVFYVKLLSSIKKRIDPLMHHYNKPTGIDINMAHAPLTGSGGHPIALRKRFLEYGHFDGLFNTLKEIESHGYHIIDTKEDLEYKWEEIVSFKPDFIKINLLYSEEYLTRKNDTAYFGKKGLDPSLVPDIVKKAHDHNLRVSAHVATAHDFHVAVAAGVDEIAHLPEIHNGKPIDLEDAKLAFQKGVVVVTTASLVTKNKEKPNYGALLGNVRSNLEILKNEGVTMAIGSDMYNDNSVDEFQLLHSLDLFTNLELLKMWCENSATTTLPYRKVGFLKDGFEASFLVLDQNPLEDIKNINQTITLRVKQGVILE